MTLESHILYMFLLLLHPPVPPLALLNCPVPCSLPLKVLPVVFGISFSKLELGLVSFAVEPGRLGGVDGLSAALGEDFLAVHLGRFFLQEG